ncbi:hypothetical protein FEDK69T_18360 [Flavobacterium enshiense DK69]|uniref:Haem-binding uptake Tiki superfamily ChaN domain-containing protein n=1 Tax=Flavobacterium enshiense DK69 TaxID=1107311 RepID=V6S7A1_9FLAO|nr:radical SAM protein [Flavobacterium enshiense]ESU22583.1 hypothetical protein FEDK69T_18360 [Flavobacterium enshiense DK69]KGO95704.1 hypothetical protein Q767_10840 [Flavobacterium enshiense DK69]
MKKISLFIVIILLNSCSSSISPYFESNKYINEDNWVINDNLQFSHESYGDVNFLKDKSSLKRHLKTAKFHYDNILVYGKTWIDPIYEYYILVDSKKTLNKSADYFQKDTLINNHKFTFIGIPLDKHNPADDFNKLSKKITSGTDYTKKLPSLFDIIRSNKSSNQFLKGLTEFNNYPSHTKAENWNKLQMQLTFASFLGQNNTYNKLIKQWSPNKTNDTIAALIKQKSINGLQDVEREILEIAKDEKIIMFNENHFYPNHRILVTQLLPDLKKAGFNYIALETLAEKQDSILNNGGKLDMESGFYTREQHFAELIRTAQELGFHFVTYENFEKVKDRETSQADNLYNATFAKDSNARVLVLAGISHIMEEPDSNEKKWMAALFKEKYGINTITFSQTDLNSYSNLTESVTLLKSVDLDKKYQTTDYKIINNLPFKENKGNFSYKNNHSKNVQATLYFDEELLKSTDYSKKVPYRCYLLEKNETFSMTLSNSKMRLMVFDEDGKMLENKIVN